MCDRWPVWLKTGVMCVTDVICETGVVCVTGGLYG